jgi:ketosteroid isomerase-like protein
VSAGAVRQALGSADGGRTLDQRVAVRFPQAAAANARLIASLPPSSRVRQAQVKRWAESSLAAYNRRDLAAALAGATPDFEYRPNPDWVEAGLVEASYRGLEGYRRFVETVDEVWGGQNFLTPLELFDLGDRLLVLASGRMQAQASGVWLTEEFAMIVTLEDGRATSAQEYYDHARAKTVAGVAG